MKTTRAWIIIVSMLVFLGGKASAYCIIGSGCPQSGTGWSGDTATFHSNGFSGSNSTFDSAFADALNSWNGLSNFSYSSINDTVDPCGGPDSTRGWKFDSTICGDPFGSSTLAVTDTWRSGSTNEIIDSDIIFNNAKTWDVHNGSDSPGGPFDFRRVAVHELGHALGLGHDDTFSAIMRTFYSQTIEKPQPDDINGLVAIYGGTSFTDIKANGSDGPITPTSNLSVTVALDSGSLSGDNADWWVAANVSGTSTIDGWYYFDLSTLGFVFAGPSPFDILVTLQDPLSNITPSGVVCTTLLGDFLYPLIFIS